MIIEGDPYTYGFYLFDKKTLTWVCNIFYIACFYWVLRESRESKKTKFAMWRKGSRDVAEKLRKPIRPQDESKQFFLKYKQISKKKFKKLN